MRPDAACDTGCVALTERARLIGARAVSRHPIAVPGGREDEQERPRLPRRRRDVRDQGRRRTHGAAVFSAIGDALARDEPVTIAGFGNFVMRSRAGRQGRYPKPGSPSPSRPRGRRRSMRQRPFETRSTDRVARQAARCRPIVPAMSPRHARTFAMHTRPSTRSIHRRLRQTDRRNRVSGVAWATSAVQCERDRADVGPHPPGPAMFVAETRCRETLQFATRANPCAVARGTRIPSRARVLHVRIRFFACDNDTRRCAQVEVHTFPSRLRRWTTNNPPPRATAATAHHRFHQIMAEMPTPPKFSIIRHHLGTKAIRYSSVSPTPIRLAPQHRKP